MADGITGATTGETVEIKKPTKPVRPVKVKGFPFDTQTATARQAAKDETTRRLTITPDVHIDLVWIPAGSFVMGNNRTPSASPAFKANVKEGFWMSTTEITNEQFRALFPGTRQPVHRTDLERSYYPRLCSQPTKTACRARQLGRSECFLPKDQRNIRQYSFSAYRNTMGMGGTCRKCR